MSRILCDYVNKTRSEVKRSVVVGFSQLQEDALRAMKDELGLSMTISELRFCQKAYRSSGNHAPTLDEIYFLDAVASGHHRSKDFASVAHLQLYHAEAVRTYRDLLEKRTLLAGIPRSDVPSLRELSEILSGVLLRSGRQADLKDTYVTADPFEKIEAAAMGLIPMERLSVAPSLPSAQLFSGSAGFSSKSKKAEEGDAILLLRCPLGESTDTGSDPIGTSLMLRISRFAKAPIYKENIHAYRAVDNRGISVALLALYNGMYVELDAIPSVFDYGELYDLALAEHGALLVAVPPCAAEAFAKEAERHGILASCIARAVKGDRLTVRRAGHAPYSFPASFLRAFSEYALPFLLEGKKEPDATQTPLHTVASEHFSGETIGAMPAASLSSGLASAAGSRMLSFEKGINAALLSVFEAVLSGAKLSRISVSDLYVYPEKITSHSLGSLFEAFLGVYRVLAELALPNKSSFLPFSEGKVSIEGMAVYCLDCAEKVRSDHFTAHGAGIYLIALPKSQSGIYDFSAVRSLLSLLSDLLNGKKILSSRIGAFESPREVLEKMCGPFTVKYDPSVSEDALGKKLDGIFLVIEATSEIKEFKRIGRVFDPERMEIVTEETIVLPGTGEAVVL